MSNKFGSGFLWAQKQNRKESPSGGGETERRMTLADENPCRQCPVRFWRGREAQGPPADAGPAPSPESPCAPRQMLALQAAGGRM